MPIICFPDDQKPRKTVVCALCGKDIPLSKATAGLFDADGKQTFACNDHFWKGHDFILGWLDFGAHVRLELLARGEEPRQFSDRGEGDDWLIS